jgi:putrescine transport system permease protein
MLGQFKRHRSQFMMRHENHLSGLAGVLRRMFTMRVAGTMRNVLIAVPFAWLLVFFLLPFLLVAKISLSESELGQPPYGPLVRAVSGGTVIDRNSRTSIDVTSGYYVQAQLENFKAVFADPLYYQSYLNSLKIAGVSTLVCLLLGYPVAYGISRASRRSRNILLMLIILPFWTSFLVRIYAWMAILRNEGVINKMLLWSGIVEHPVVMLHTTFAVYAGIVYSYLPFMILPLYSTLEKLNRTLLEAAADLGARPARAFWRITFPLSLPGVIAGSMLVFIPAVGEYVIPELLGSDGTPMIGRVLWNEFFLNRDWPLASALALLMLLILVAPLMLFQRYRSRIDGAR